MSSTEITSVTSALPAPIINLMNQVAPKIDRLLDDPDFTELRGSYGHNVAMFVQGITPAQRQALRQALPALTRPATADEIATHVALTIAAFPNLGKVEGEQRMHVWLDDIAAENPTIYELMSACRETRRKYEFFTEAVLMKEMERARRRSEICRGLAG